MQSASVSILSFAFSHGLTKHTMSYYVDEWQMSFLLLSWWIVESWAAPLYW